MGRLSATGEAVGWARSEFSAVRLGDSRREERLVALGACACDRPHGRVAVVFDRAKEREGAYDFLENAHVEPKRLMAGVAEATARRCDGLPFVYVPVDGTSLTVVDHGGMKDFGRIGASTYMARGVKVIDALAVSPAGVPLGFLALNFWTRSQPPLPRRRSQAIRARPLAEKETGRWVEAIRATARVLDEHGVRAWFQIDREGDAGDILTALAATDHWWTVRNNADRSVAIEGGHGRLRALLESTTPHGEYSLAVSGTPSRKERDARLEVRVARVTLRLRDRRTDRRTPSSATAVWARETQTTPDGEAPIDWLLLTNRDVNTLADALAVIKGYTQRWRIEECHRTWKSGGCNVEETQLRSFAAVQRWAIILAAVATRIEQLKRLARTEPEQPATVALTPLEIRALMVLKRRNKKRTEKIPEAPTIEQAVLWIAELGGYMGKKSDRPGATTIQRGLAILAASARMLEALLESGESR